MAHLGLSVQPSTFYRTTTGARHQRCRPINCGHLKGQKRFQHGIRASRDTENSPAVLDSVPGPARQSIPQQV